MKRRLFLQTAAGLFAAPAVIRSASAATPAEAQITLPPAKDLISSFGWITDVHYCTSPTRTIPKEDSIRVYAHSMAKMRQAIDLFNTRKLDFVIELGDFKDCLDDGDRPGTIAFLQTVESEFRRVFLTDDGIA